MADPSGRGSAAMATVDRIYGAAFLLVGIGALIGAIRLEIGTPSQPEPGFFPGLAAFALVILSALLVVQDLRGRGSGGEPFGALRPPLLALAGLVAFVALLGPLGYVPATAVLAAVLLVVLDVRRAWIFAVMVPFVSLGTYALFDRLLGVPLPAGPLAAWLGP